jgi:hypothetical protein
MGSRGREEGIREGDGDEYDGSTLCSYMKIE